MDIAARAYDFSVRIAELVKYLREDQKDFPLSERLLSCGVGAGLALRANDREKAVDSLREADYLLEMAVKSGYLKEIQSKHIRQEGRELLAILEEKELEGQNETK